MASWGHSEMAALQDICREAPDAGLRAAQPSVVARVGPAAVGADAGKPSKPCTRCQGDCDKDSDCQGNLRCFQRNKKEKVPGCYATSQGDIHSYDHCCA